jgi:hypothetical protein
LKKVVFKSPKNPKNPTIEEFSSMVESHDPTWIWSQDPDERERGEFERRAIDAARRQLGDEKAVGIWNRSMHRKVVPAMLHEFLWTSKRRPKTA